MKINELVQKTGLTAPTIRYYEKEGILDIRHVHRGANNYRDYDEEAVDQLLTVKKLQKAGFTLAELKLLNEAGGEEAMPLHLKIAMLRKKITEIERKKAELDQVQCILVKMLTNKISLQEAEGSNEG